MALPFSVTVSYYQNVTRKVKTLSVNADTEGNATALAQKKTKLVVGEIAGVYETKAVDATGYTFHTAGESGLATLTLSKVINGLTDYKFVKIGDMAKAYSPGDGSLNIAYPNADISDFVSNWQSDAGVSGYNFHRGKFNAR